MTDLFTKQERLFILFLLAGIIMGGIVKWYRSRQAAKLDLVYRQQLAETERQLRRGAQTIDSLLQRDSTLMLTALPTETASNVKLAGRSVTQAKRRVATVVNVNSASVEELMQLPQVGAVIAQRILEYRQLHGPFKTAEELMKVKGIGQKKFAAMKPFVRIEKE
ncbi:MAG: helix-hairpin-helix domain-containing protein [candidate division KSB1 bacterium]|nr:helix-hairpin-helix domain-containing protein [candidate division KSB1 bacterium]MDZ7318110.1 helix-hairpin-helix domain-containing protein [candidate division KSB1 bacterium]MDZ7340508.1 helix-hairpin-helix domain-containing protein [candidate division KSB1 bacterium]